MLSTSSESKSIQRKLQCFSLLRSERVTTNENGITNGIEIYKNRSGALRVMASNNDCVLRSFDGETLKLSRFVRMHASACCARERPA